MALGDRIRSARRSRRLTLRQLSEAAGVSVSFLSDIEVGRTSPSVATLERIAGALAMPVGELFADAAGPDRARLLQSLAELGGALRSREHLKLGNTTGAEAPIAKPGDTDEPRYDVIRAGERSVLVWPTRTGREYLLTPDFLRRFAVTVSEDDPGREDVNSIHDYDGETFALILEGTYEFKVGGRVHMLQHGDSINFSHRLPHAFRVMGVVPGRILWVEAPPAIDPVRLGSPFRVE